MRRLNTRAVQVSCSDANISLVRPINRAVQCTLVTQKKGFSFIFELVYLRILKNVLTYVPIYPPAFIPDANVAMRLARILYWGHGTCESALFSSKN